MRNQIKFLSAAVISAVLTACGGANLGTGGSNSFGGPAPGGTGTAPTGIVASLELTTLQAEITSDGVSSSTLTATLLDTAGQPVAGRMLNFTTTAGMLSPADPTNFASTAQVTTDGAGRAVARLRSTTQAGTATVTASEPASGLTARFDIQFRPGGGVNPRIFVSPSVVAPGGNVTIVVQVTDANGNPTENVGLLLTGTNNSGGQFTGDIAPTDSNGVSTTTYVAGPTPGTDTFRVRLAGGQSATGTLSVVVGTAAIGGIQLAVGAETAVADNNSKTAVNATVTDTRGNPVPNSPVTFTTSVGTLVRAITDAGGTGAITVNTDNAGVARAFLVSTTRAGTATVTASTAGFSSNGTVRFVAGPATSVTVTATPATLAPNTQSTISALVLDVNSNPVEGRTVQFSVGSGRFMNSQAATTSGVTNVDGLVNVIYIAPPATTATSATITATVTPENRSGIAVVQFASGTATSVLLAVSPTSLAPGGAATARATVVDELGNRIAGRQVTFVTTAGSTSGARFSPAVGTSDISGEVTAMYTAPTTGTSDSLVARTPGAGSAVINSNAVTINISSSNNVPSSVTLVASSPNLQTGATSAAQGVTLTALVKDANNNLLSGIPVSFSSVRQAGTMCGNGGALAVTPPGTTDASGTVQAILTTGGDPQNQIITVTASAGGNSSSLNINVTGTTLQFTGPTTLGRGADGDYAINFRDSAGRGIPNQAVTIMIGPLGNKFIFPPFPTAPNRPAPGAFVPAGTATSVMATTDANGQVLLRYTDTSPSGGTDRLTASITNNCSVPATQNIQVSAQSFQFVAGPMSSTGVALTGTFVVVTESGTATQQVNVGSAANAALFAIGDVARINDGTDTITGIVTAIAAPNLTVDTTAITHPAAGVAGGTMGDTAATVTRPNNEVAIAAANDPGVIRFQTAVVQLSGGTFAGQVINFSTTRGLIDNPADAAAAATTATATTNANGVAFINIRQALGTSGTGGGVITASGSNGVSATQAFAVVSRAPTRISLQATPNAIPTSTGTSTIQATVRDNDNNPVQDAIVNFTLSDASGGRLSASTGTSNSQGLVSVTYLASSSASARNGVIVRGTLEPSTSAACPAGSGVPCFAEATLTVGGQALRIVLGTGNTIQPDPNNPATFYQYPYSVLVTDSAGNPPAAGTTVSLLAEATAYQKGVLVCPIAPWRPAYTVTGADIQASGFSPPPPNFGCINEDANRNGIFDAGEDFNTNTLLDPGTVVSVPSSVTLRTDGTQNFFITYPKDRANWVQARITAVVSVNGTESTEVQTFVLLGLADDYDDCAIGPPGQTSPYGTATTCNVP